MNKRAYRLLPAGALLALAIGLVLWAKPLGHPTPEQVASGAAAPTALPGQSSTLLPDGRLLLLGGESAGGPVGTASVEDPATGSTTALPNGLSHARAWHTATLLPDGTVLVFGGVAADGHIVTTAELFDPASGKFADFATSGLTPRSHHTATLLTDGRVLVAGGISDSSETLGSAQLWDPRASASTNMLPGLLVARHGHTATLEPDGTVLVWGGVDQNGLALNYGEIFDPGTQAFQTETNRPSQAPGQPLQVEATLPEDGSENVAVDVLIALRFSEPLQVQTVNESTLTLSGPGGNLAAKVVPAEGGLLAFVTPQSPLAEGTAYTVTLAGPTAPGGISLGEFTFSFTTAGQPAPAPGAGIAGGSTSWPGGPQNSPWRKLPPLKAPPGVTAISGQVLLLSGLPLKDVTLRVGGISTESDGTGRFLLRNVPSGHDVMVMDGRTGNTRDAAYGVFEVGVDVTLGQTNVLNYTSWMPQIDTAHAVTIPVPTTSETVITTPLIPGLEFHIPANTTITDMDGNAIHQLSITPIPVSQPPFPLPPGVNVPVYFTIQPGSSYIRAWDPNGPKGGWLVYPNSYHQPAGSRFDFWNYDADNKWNHGGENNGWYIYGHGSVSTDRQSIVPDPGVVIYELTGAMVGGSGEATGSGPSWWCRYLGIFCSADPVDPSTGLFLYHKTDLYEPDVIPIVLTRTYRQNDSASRAFGIGTSHPYDTFLVGDVFPYTYLDVVFEDGSRTHFTRTSPGTSYTDAVYQCNSAPGPFFGATIVWNGTGWTLTRRDGTNYVFHEGFNSTRAQQGAVLSITDRNGNTLTVTRDSNSNITQITSPNGRWIQFTYDSNYRITQATDSIGRTVSYSYDANGRLVQVTDAAGGAWKYAYDSNNNMTSVTDPRNITYLQNQYDYVNHVSKQTLADGGAFSFNYTGCETPAGPSFSAGICQTSVTDPNGNTRTLIFDTPPYFPDGYVTGGNVAHDIFADGTPQYQEFTYLSQAGTNLISSIADPLRRTTSFTYDALGNTTSITRLSGTPNAVTTSFTYDGTFSQPLSVTDPLGHATSFAYDSKGDLTGVTDPLGNASSFAYDGEGHIVSATDAVGKTTQFGYDGGDLASVTDPLGRATQFFADAGGRLASVTDPLGHLTRYQYNALNQITTITDALSGVTSFTYDPNGNLLSVTDPKNIANPTTYTYDNMDRLATRKDPLGNTESYQYDKNGNLMQFTDRRGKVTTYTYDALNRPTFAGFGTQPGPTYESTINYSFDAGNRLTQAVDSITGTITRSYDGLDRLLSEATPQGTVSYAYDAAGRRTSMTVAGQPAVNYTYDNANRLTGISQGTANVSFAYDAAGRRTSLTLPNGIAIGYNYDQASELAGLTYSLSGTMLGNLTYSYDLAGRRTSVGGSFARTGIPLPVSTTAYNAANELTQWGTANLFYDANGNMTSDGTNSFVWNTRNQLASMNASTISFQYDPFGRRVGKTISGATTNYLYDGLNPVQELSGTTVTANLLTGLGVDEYFTRTDSSGARNFLADSLGSTLALADSTGAVQTTYTYEPFGNTAVAGTASANPYQYTGRENDGTGLYFYRARYYNPTFQRFVAEDPIGFAGGTNLYAYVGNAPSNFADPVGLDKRDPLSRSAMRPRGPLPPGANPWRRATKPQQPAPPEEPKLPKFPENEPPPKLPWKNEELERLLKLLAELLRGVSERPLTLPVIVQPPQNGYCAIDPSACGGGPPIT